MFERASANLALFGQYVGKVVYAWSLPYAPLCMKSVSQTKEAIMNDWLEFIKDVSWFAKPSDVISLTGIQEGYHLSLEACEIFQIGRAHV